MSKPLDTCRLCGSTENVHTHAGQVPEGWKLDFVPNETDTLSHEQTSTKPAHEKQKIFIDSADLKNIMIAQRALFVRIKDGKIHLSLNNTDWWRYDLFPSDLYIVEAVPPKAQPPVDELYAILADVWLKGMREARINELEIMPSSTFNHPYREYIKQRLAALKEVKCVS